MGFVKQLLGPCAVVLLLDFAGVSGLSNASDQDRCTFPQPSNEGQRQNSSIEIQDMSLNSDLKCRHYDNGYLEEQKISIRLESRSNRTVRAIYNGKCQNNGAFSTVNCRKSKIEVTLNNDGDSDINIRLTFIGMKNRRQEIPEKNATSLKYPLSHLGLFSVSVQGQNLNPVKIIYGLDLSFDSSLETHQRNPVTNVTAKCVRLDEYDSWEESNCRTESNTTNIKCTCELDNLNNTIFGVMQILNLFRVPKFVYISGVVIPILLGITCFILSVSVFLLSIYRKQLKSRRTFIQLGITISFLLEGLTALVTYAVNHVNDTPEGNLCAAIPILEMYFKAMTSCWLLLDGIILLIKIQGAGYFGYEKVVSGRNMKILCACASLIPAVVFVSFGVWDSTDENLLENSNLYDVMKDRDKSMAKNYPENNYKEYQNRVERFTRYKYCCVEHTSVTFIACLVTMGVVLVVNLAISIYVTRIVWKKTANEECDPTRVLTTARAAATLALSLGLPQFAAVFAAIFVNGVVAKILIPNFVIILQGPLVFYFYCFRNSELMKALAISLNRSLP